MHRLTPALLLLFLLAACSEPVTAPASTTIAPPTTTTAPPPTTLPATTQAPPESPCLEGDRPFATGGIISAFGGASGDAAQISAIRAADHIGCERVVVDLVTVDGAPAGSVGLTGVEYNETAGVVRINLPPDVSRSAVANLLLDGELTNQAFVVRTTAGHLAIDIHVVAGVGVALRAFEVDAPSRIVVDFRIDTDAPAVSGARFGDGVVVMQPSPGPATVPLVISGYARTFEANVTARLHQDRADAPILETSTTATDWTEAWGEYEMVLSGIPNGELELFVGSDSPVDGSPLGVWIPLEFGSGATADGG